MNKGVPQGSVLGPPIFCTYVSSFSPTHPNTSVFKYADDISLIIPLDSSSPAYICNKVNSEIVNAMKWCQDNALLLNSAKSKCLLVTRRNAVCSLPLIVDCVSSLRFLGFYINNKLTCDAHVEKLRITCARRLHILRKLRSMIPRHVTHSVYEAIIRSLMDYACPLLIGMNKKQANVLNRLVRRAHRIMDYGCLDVEQCNKCDPHSRRLDLSERLWRKIESNPNHILRDLIPPKLPRTKQYNISYARTQTHSNSFFPFMARTLNSLTQRNK